jgi:hypothetical protein
MKKQEQAELRECLNILSASLLSKNTKIKIYITVI